LKNITIRSFILCLISIFSSSCSDKKTEIFIYTGKGRAQALHDSVIWNCYSNYNKVLYVGNDTISIKLFTFYADGCEKETLAFYDINKNIGKYYLHKKLYNLPYPFINTSALFFISDCDAIIKCYEIKDEDTNNYIEITEVDTIHNIVFGKFNATLINNANNYDTTKFSDGWFEFPYT
jgi:hypothetical protein